MIQKQICKGKAHLSLLFILTFFCSTLYGQSISELYKQGNFQELIKLEKRAPQLTADELYMVGFAFFQTENDAKAIAFYDMAIAKGLNSASVHFFKGLSLRYLKRYDDALNEIDFSLKLDPGNQEYMNERGIIYYSQNDFDKAMQVFEEAKKLPSSFPEPYYWIARIYHEKEEFNKALAAYYEAEKNLSSKNSYYLTTLLTIGQLEFTFNKDFKKSINAYEAAIAMDSGNYAIYYKLINSYNSNKDYKKADSIFSIIKTAYRNKKLPEEDMEFKAISIAQFEWNGQIAVVRKSLEDAQKTLDIAYKIFLQNLKGDSVQRRFVIEKTFQFEKETAGFLLCEQDKKTGAHITYPYGWSNENIDAGEIEKAVKLVLDGKLKQGASSVYNKK